MASPEEILDLAWDALHQKFREQGFGHFNKSERLWYELVGLRGEIGNGGILQFFYNYGADHISLVLEGLKTIGAEGTLVFVEEVAKIFEGAKPNTRANRIALMEDWSDDEYPDEFWEDIDHRLWTQIADLDNKLDVFAFEQRIAEIPRE